MATTSIFLHGESHGQRSLVGYSPWGCRESDMTELLTLSHFYFLINILANCNDLSETQHRGRVTDLSRLGFTPKHQGQYKSSRLLVHTTLDSLVDIQGCIPWNHHHTCRVFSLAPNQPLQHACFPSLAKGTRVCLLAHVHFSLHNVKSLQATL